MQNHFKEQIMSDNAPELDDSRRSVFTRERQELGFLRSSLIAQLAGVNSRIAQIDGILARPKITNLPARTDFESDAMFVDPNAPKPPLKNGFDDPVDISTRRRIQAQSQDDAKQFSAPPYKHLIQ